MKYKYLFFYIIVFSASLNAQMPKTDMYLAEFENIWQSPKLLKTTFLNQFNSQGYNNQARYVSDDEIYMTVATDPLGKTDIYAINPEKSTFYYVTKTPEISEFSAIPFENTFATVRIEADGKDQSLWLYPKDRSHQGKRLFPKLSNVGYFSWLDKNNFAMFLVGKPHQLAIGNSVTEDVQIVTENIGRCLKTNGEEILYFVDKSKTDIWYLKQYDLLEKNIQTLISMPVGSEDFDFIDGKFITAQGSKILTWNPNLHNEWKTLIDYAVVGIQNINRPSIYKNKIIFINNK